MKAQLALVGLCLCVSGQQFFEVSGRIDPPSQASVTLHAIATPFATSTLADSSGKFRFQRIDPGSYTLIVFLPGRGETRNTIDVGPGTADEKGRVVITAHIDESRLMPDARSHKYRLASCRFRARRWRNTRRPTSP